jgi:hypothetical protein
MLKNRGRNYEHLCKNSRFFHAAPSRRCRDGLRVIGAVGVVVGLDSTAEDRERRAESRKEKEE